MPLNHGTAVPEMRTNMRLIDADEAIINFGFEWDDISPTRDEFVAFLKKQPTIDAVPVVRCQDCIRRYDTDECPMCFLIEGKYYEYTNENGFCDRGERKEGAE